MVSTPAKRPWPFVDHQSGAKFTALTRPSPQSENGKQLLDLSDWLNISPCQVLELNSHRSPPNTFPSSHSSAESSLPSPMMDRCFTSDSPHLASVDDSVFKFSKSNGTFLSASSAADYPSPLEIADFPGVSSHPVDSTDRVLVLVNMETIQKPRSPDSRSISLLSPSIGPTNASSLPTTPDPFSSLTVNSLPIGQSSVSPVAHRSEGYSTPLSTLSDDETEPGGPMADISIAGPIPVTICTSDEHPKKRDEKKHTFMDKLRNAFPPSSKATPASARFSPDLASFPLNSPFQLRHTGSGDHTPLSSSSLSSAIQADGDHKPRSDCASSARPSKRFKPSLLSINLTPSFTDAVIQANVRTFEEDGHRYRTRSKLRSLRAEIEAIEKDEDLGIIRGFLEKAPNEKVKQSRRQTRGATGSKMNSTTMITRHAAANGSVMKKSSDRVPGTSTSVYDTINQYTSVNTGTETPEPSLPRRTSTSKTKSKRTLNDSDSFTSSLIPTKKTRRNLEKINQNNDGISTASGIANVIPFVCNPSPLVDHTIRTFPHVIFINTTFPLLYRRFPLCSSFDPNSKLYPKPTVPQPGGLYNPPRNVLDLYTPRFVKGIGRDKVGLCPICYEPKSRGGAGTSEWLSMKFSAFKYYHMQYVHGISPTTTLPFSPPISFRSSRRQPNHKNEKVELLEGECHNCRNWVPMEGVKCVEAKLKEIYWWKHAASCHKGSTIDGETDIYLEDPLSLSILNSMP